MIGRDTAAIKAAKALVLGVWLILTLFPFYWMVATSLKAPGAIASFPLQYWPEHPTVQNYISLFAKSNFGAYITNSLAVSFAAALFATLIALLSGYVLARFSFRGRGAVMMAFLVTQMVPAFIALGALYQMMVKLDLVDRRFGLVVVYVAMCIPFSSIMLKGFFDNVPEEIEEAAMVDGCNRVTALFRVIVPVMTPGILATFIFDLVNCWNELFLSVTLMNSDSNRTIPGALNGFVSSFNIEWGPLSAAAVLAVVPTMILFAFASKYIVQGLTAGSTKG
jgi:multiple sugar transport system permease protein